jgi:hypothetical protein
MSGISSPIQNHILSRLKHAKSVRYRDLSPEKTPNDLFNYHLQFLVSKDYVVKTRGGYALSEKGIRHIADTFADRESAGLFKLNVITIVSRTRGKRIEILNQQRTSNPSFGKIGVMGGVVRKGEPIEHAATRKLKEETGLDAEFTLVGMERRMLYRDGTLFSDAMFPICYSAYTTGTLLERSAFGRNFWVPIETAIRNESAVFDSIKSIVTVLEAIQKGRIRTLPFFMNEIIQSNAVQE